MAPSLITQKSSELFLSLVLLPEPGGWGPPWNGPLHVMFRMRGHDWETRVPCGAPLRLVSCPVRLNRGDSNNKEEMNLGRVCPGVQRLSVNHHGCHEQTPVLVETKFY